jgi:hypothetical protein
MNPHKNNIGDEAEKVVREAVAAHNSHMPPGMEKLAIRVI